MSVAHDYVVSSTTSRPNIVITTYRFDPKWLWVPFRWEYEDGTDAYREVFPDARCW